VADASNAPLFTSFALGSLKLPNRFVMSPLTRGRAQPDGTPVELMAQYYVQRASAGLIVTEATAISRQGAGWLGAPGIYTDAHVAGWKSVTDAVHKAGSRIFLQLWHTGRVSHPDFLEGEPPVAPSAIAAKGTTKTPKGKRDYVTPRELKLPEIAATIADYGAATKRAKAAGFDGVELHGANGYLVDQFLRDVSNRRTDAYGGSIANRVRFLDEAIAAIVAAWSPDRVGVHLSPVGTYNDMKDSSPRELFVAAAEALARRKIAYLHVVEGLPGTFMHVDHPERISPFMRKAFRGAFIVNGGYDAKAANAAIQSGETDLVSFGTAFLANPDFPERVRRGAPLNAPDPSTFYTPGAKGYVDYPALNATKGSSGAA
jgi:N-ethylmaleimide reductase